jgi:hypothetical protein
VCTRTQVGEEEAQGTFDMNTQNIFCVSASKIGGNFQIVLASFKGGDQEHPRTIYGKKLAELYSIIEKKKRSI